jgi:hypothetical protein
MITDTPTSKPGENKARIIFGDPSEFNRRKLIVSQWTEALGLGDDIYLQIDGTSLRVSRGKNPKIHDALKNLQQAIIQENGGKWEVYEH